MSLASTSTSTQMLSASGIEVLARPLVEYDEDGRLAACVEHLAHRAHFNAFDRLDAAAFELPVVELALFQLDRLRLGDGQLAARRARRPPRASRNPRT